jgi:hypothetical protein
MSKLPHIDAALIPAKKRVFSIITGTFAF